MKTSIFLSNRESCNVAAEVLSALGLLDKVEIHIRPVLSRSKTSQFHGMTIHEHLVVKMENNKLVELVSGQEIPSTNQGTIDKDRLVDGMLSRSFHFAR